MKAKDRELLIEQAWSDRWNHRVESALKTFVQIQTESNWSHLSAKNLQSLATRDQGHYLDLILLQGSLLRAQGSKSKASVILAKVLREVDELGLPYTFRLMFELGLDQWVDQNTAKALEYFLRAEVLAHSKLQSCFASINILLCLESLDLDRSDREQSSWQLLSSVPKSENKSIENVREQIYAYELRRHFYRKLELLPRASAGQPGFFRDWVSALPYFNKGTKPGSIDRYLWEGSYRQRTLAKVWTSSDQYGVKVSDAIDRIYLWTWQLMQDWSTELSQYCSHTLNYILEHIEIENQSKEDMLLLRNAIGWLLLMFPSLKSNVSIVVKSLNSCKSSNYPVLEAEFDLQNFIARESVMAPTYSASMASVLKWPYIEFHELAKDWPSRLVGLATRLRPVEALGDSGTEVLVDLSSGKILLVRDRVSVASKALCEFLNDLSEGDPISINEYTKFDALNLIYRARKLFGQNCITTNRGTVAPGSAWPKIEFQNQIESTDWTREPLLTRVAESQAYLHAARALFPDKFKRKDLETKLKVSKASANRMLKHWISKNYLTVGGKSKSSIYFWGRN